MGNQILNKLKEIVDSSNELKLKRNRNDKQTDEDDGRYFTYKLRLSELHAESILPALI